MIRRATHRSEHTGSAPLGRVQENVRDLHSFVKGEVSDFAWFHGVGVKRVQVQDRDFRLTPDELRAATIIIDGPLTAPRRCILPEVTDARAFQRWFENATGQDLTLINADGSHLLTAVAGTGFIVVSADGPVGYT